MYSTYMTFLLTYFDISYNTTMQGLSLSQHDSRFLMKISPKWKETTTANGTVPEVGVTGVPSSTV